MNERLFAIGDIHGCFDSLKQLLENRIELVKSDKVILLGDYIDRGDRSKEVIDYIIELIDKGYDIIPLKGNHEAMLSEAATNAELFPHWISNGGGNTLKSFGIDSLDNMESSYLDFFKNLRYYFEFEDYLFVHAGFNDENENPFNDKYHMIWSCREQYSHPMLKNKIIIHGHNPIRTSTFEKLVNSNSRVFNIDTGCVYSHRPGYGRLSALELRTQSIFFV